MQLNVCNVTYYLLLKLKQVTVEMLLQSLISKVYAQLLKTVFLVPIPTVVRFSYKCQKEYQYIHVGAENMSLHDSENFELLDTVNPVVAETLNDTWMWMMHIACIWPTYKPSAPSGHPSGWSIIFRKPLTTSGQNSSSGPSEILLMLGTKIKVKCTMRISMAYVERFVRPIPNFNELIFGVRKLTLNDSKP